MSLTGRYDFGDFVFDIIDTSIVDDRIILSVAAGDSGFLILSVEHDSIRILNRYVEEESEVKTVFARSDTLLVGHGYYGYFGIPESGLVQVFDISNPSSPEQIHEKEIDSDVVQLHLDSLVYVLTSNGLHVYEIEDSLVLLCSYNESLYSFPNSRYTSFDIARFGDNTYAYVTIMGWLEHFNGFFTFDLTNPEDTIIKLDSDTSEFWDWGIYSHLAINIRVSGDNLCLYDNCCGWFIYSLDNPEDPVEIEGAHWQHNGNNNGYGLIFDSPFIYSCTGDDGFYILYWDSTVGIDYGHPGKVERFIITAFPNPFNSSCMITIVGDGRARPAKVEIFDLRGNVICMRNVGARHSLQDVQSDIQLSGNASPLQDGARAFIWHPDESISSGIYLIHVISTDGSIATKKILYLK